MVSHKVFQGSDGQFYFVIKAKNGQVLAASEGYTRRRDANIGLEALREAMVQIPHAGKPSLLSRMKATNLEALTFDPGCA